MHIVLSTCGQIVSDLLSLKLEQLLVDLRQGSTAALFVSSDLMLPGLRQYLSTLWTISFPSLLDVGVVFVPSMRFRGKSAYAVGLLA